MENTNNPVERALLLMKYDISKTLTENIDKSNKNYLSEANVMDTQNLSQNQQLAVQKGYGQVSPEDADKLSKGGWTASTPSSPQITTKTAKVTTSVSPKPKSKIGNPKVTELQNKLLDLGISVGTTGADGILGKNTMAAVDTLIKKYNDLKKAPQPAAGTSAPAAGTPPPTDGTSAPAAGTPPPAAGTPPPADGATETNKKSNEGNTNQTEYGDVNTYS